MTNWEVTQMPGKLEQAALHSTWVSRGMFLLDATTSYTVAQALVRTNNIAGIKSVKEEPDEGWKVLRITLRPRGYSDNPQRLNLMVNALAKSFLVQDHLLTFSIRKDGMSKDVTREEWVAIWAKK